MAELLNVSGKVVKAHSHREMCPVPNAVDEVMRLNNRYVKPHQHVWSYSSLQLPDKSWAKVARCKLTQCGVRVMTMVEPIETKTWGVVDTGTTISERARA
jgi:hypothetical protein